MPVPPGEGKKFKPEELRTPVHGHGGMAPLINGRTFADGTPVAPRGPDKHPVRKPIRRLMKLALADHNGQAMKDFAKGIQKACRTKDVGKIILLGKLLLMLDDVADPKMDGQAPIRSQFVLESDPQAVTPLVEPEPTVAEMAGEHMQSVEDLE